MNTNQNDSDDIVAEINMTPLIDIMLVLLIIFMVSSTAALESGLDVDLPEVSATMEVKNQEIVVISLAKDGRLAVQGKAVTSSTLQDAIAKKLVELKTTAVVFEGDTQSQLGNVVTVMDVAKLAGAKNFSIAADKSEIKLEKKI
jgi:biopolymer transport protein ExbD